VATDENPQTQESLGSPFLQDALEFDSTGKLLEDADFERSQLVLDSAPIAAEDGIAYGFFSGPPSG